MVNQNKIFSFKIKRQAKKHLCEWCWKDSSCLVQFYTVLFMIVSGHVFPSTGMCSYFHYTPGIRSMPKGYIVFIRSVSSFVRPPICLNVVLSVNPFYNQVLLRSFLITYNSAATDQKLFTFRMGYLGGFSSILHLWTPGSCHRVGLEVKI